MDTRTKHFVLAAVAILALGAGIAIPGSLAFVIGMLTFLVLPFGIRQPIGVATRIDEGTRYVTGPTTAEKIDGAARWLGIATWAAYGLALWSSNGDLWPAVLFAWLGLGFAGGALHGIYVRLVQAARAPSAVTLDPATMTVSSSRGTYIFRYSDLKTVEVDGTTIWVSTAKDKHQVTVVGTPALADTIARAIRERKAIAERATSDRASGTKNLERPSGMSAREWLARIDALVATSRSAGAYRGGGLEEETLWTLLGDDTADGTTRAAAARILAASDDGEVRARVASLTAEIGDEPTRVRVALAMRQDTEEAAAEMEAVELDELRKMSGA